VFDFDMLPDRAGITDRFVQNTYPTTRPIKRHFE